MALGIGLIGCGRAAERLHLPALVRTEQARLVAVADPRPERRELAAAAGDGCNRHATPEALLADARVSAVILATPPETHVPLALLCLRAGKPVLIEKPLARTPAEVRPLEALHACSPLPLMLGFNRRFWEPVRRLRQTVRERHAGEALRARLVMTTDMDTWSPVGGAHDALEDLGSHQLDLLRYVLDRPIERVAARGNPDGSIELRVGLANASAECRLLQGGTPRESIAVRGVARAYEVHLGSEHLYPAAGPRRALLDLSDGLRRQWSGRPSSLRDSYRLQLLEFLRGVTSGTQPRPGLADGVAAVRAVAAARDSIAGGGREIEVARDRGTGAGA